MKLKLSSRETIETDAITTNELAALRDHLISVGQAMDQQIREAKRNVATSGQYADGDWYDGILFAKRKNGQVVEQLKIIVSQRRKDENRAANPQTAEYFMAICRERMPDELFDAIYQEAKARSMMGKPLIERIKEAQANENA